MLPVDLRGGARGNWSGLNRYEIARILRRFRRDRRIYCLPDRSNSRGLVTDYELAGIPRLLFLCFLGSLAACGPRHLIRLRFLEIL